MHRNYLRFFLIGLISLLTCCQPEKEEEKIKLPPTPIISIEFNWGVVKSRYLRVRERPAKDAEMLGPIRLGSVVKILSRTGKQDTVDNMTNYWYQVDFQGLKGWVFGEYLEVLSSKSQAEDRASELQ